MTNLYNEDRVGPKFLSNDIKINENKVPLRVDVFYNICWKRQLCQWDVIKETFHLVYFIDKKNVAADNFKDIQEHFSTSFLIYTSSSSKFVFR